MSQSDRHFHDNLIPLYCLCHLRLGDRNKAEDAVQKIFPDSDAIEYYFITDYYEIDG